ncbi:hypothetical protein ABZY10_39100 [Streptomyces sp. NPDC006539]|uniref:hypothetical protein n=1 Tax=Streptomyces TaxID=1883 RepID=UPI0033930F77
MIIIKDAGGKIIGAQLEGGTDDEVVTYITPADPQHTLHRVSGVPAKIYDRAHPDEFHRLITAHVNSGVTEVTPITAEDLQQQYSGH